MTTRLTRRALTVLDAASIAAVHAATEADEPTNELYSEADVTEQLQSPAVDLPQSSVGLFDGERLVAFGLVSVRAREPVFKATLIGGVLPQYAGRGVGRRIVADLEAAAGRDRDRTAPDNPVEAKIAVHDTRQRTVRLVHAMGYRPWRYFSRMRRELTGAVLPALDIPAGIRIRPYRDSDEVALLRVSNEAFADHWGSTAMDLGMWRAEFSASVAARPAHSWVAVAGADRDGADPNHGGPGGDNPNGDDPNGGDPNGGDPGGGDPGGGDPGGGDPGGGDPGGGDPGGGDPGGGDLNGADLNGDDLNGDDLNGDDIVGFVLSVEYDGDTELRGFRSGYLGRVGTLRRARGRGVASALIAATLRGMAADGYRCAELDVDAESPTGAGRIYERLGFTALDRSTLFGKRI